jgi:short-subunit dehydrogenase
MYSYRKALITGASSGLGVEFARQLARQGTDVVLVARRVERLEAVATEIRAMGRTARVVPADLFRKDARSMLAQVMREEKIDLLVNNAGFGLVGQFIDASAVECENMIELNVGALVELSHAAAKVFVEHGRPAAIINVASTAAFAPMPLFAEYAATKSFVLSFSQALHEELRGRGIRVSAVCPGPTETEFGERSGVNSANVAKASMFFMSAERCVKIALKRFGTGRVVIPVGTVNSLLRLSMAVLPDFVLVPLIGSVMRAVR